MIKNYQKKKHKSNPYNVAKRMIKNEIPITEVYKKSNNVK